MGEDENSIVQVKTETEKDKGDSVTFALLARLAADGFSEWRTAIGNAEAMTLYSQSVSSMRSAPLVRRPRRTASTISACNSTSANETKGLLGL